MTITVILRCPQIESVFRIEPILQDLIAAVTVPCPRITTECFAVLVLPLPHGK